MVFDHLFYFTTPIFPEKRILEQKGFTAEFGRKHSGQGTDSKFLLFEENYIEFLWKDSSQNITEDTIGLLERANWRKNESCPFGIGLIGNIEKKMKHYFELYNPVYSPEVSIFILKESLENLKIPFLFIMQFQNVDNLQILKPLYRMKDASSGVYKNRYNIKKISSVQFRIPFLGNNQWDFLPDNILFKGGDKYSVELTAYGSEEDCFDINETIKIFISKEKK